MTPPATPADTITGVTVTACRVPTETPESDGTIEWDHTTMVIAEVHAGGTTGLGFTYGAGGAAGAIRNVLRPHVEGRRAADIPAVFSAMARATRNVGLPGIAACAVSAVDVALWDLRARLLNVSLLDLLGAARSAAPAYGSGGFTSYDTPRLQEQLGGWAREGFTKVKMKVGRDPASDVNRVRAAREALPPHVALMVDANGAYDRKQALRFAEVYAELGVTWFEEPVSSDDLDGLRLLRDRAPALMDIAAGEYGYTPWYFETMLRAGAVDVLQADATRCLGVSGFLRASALCEAHHVPLSAHTSPALHAHLACACPPARDVEYFFDHARIESMLLDGAPEVRDGALHPDRATPGHGLSLRRADVERYAIDA